MSKFEKTEDKSEIDISFAARTTSRRSPKTWTDGWIVDSGATNHMTKYRGNFSDFSASAPTKLIEMADKSKIEVCGVGSVELKTLDTSGRQVTITLKNCLYVPTLSTNLISVSTLISKGHKVSFGEGIAHIDVMGRGQIYLEIRKTGRLYELVLKDKHAEISGETSYLTTGRGETADLRTWHERFGHANIQMLRRLAGSVDGMKIRDSEVSQNNCEICMKAKLNRSPFKKSLRRASQPLELIHSDVQGPMRIPTIENHRYSINFIDDYSRFVMVYTMKSKSEALNKFKDFIADTRNAKFRVMGLRTDNGGEYTSREFEEFCRNNGIRRELTIPGVPEQNGVAERCWRTLNEMGRALLRSREVSERWWGRAIIMAAYIRNRCLTNSLPEGVTPFEKFTGKRPDVRGMKIFGSRVVVHNDDQQKGKWMDRGLPGIFFGIWTSDERVCGICTQQGESFDHPKCEISGIRRL